MTRKSLKLNELQIGHYICLPMGWTSHPFMRNNFKIKNAEQLTVLKGLELSDIEVIPEKSDVSVPDSQAQQDSLDTPKEAVKELDEDARWQKEVRSNQRRAAKAHQVSSDAFRQALTAFKSQPEQAYFLLFENVNKTLAPLYQNKQQVPVYLCIDRQADEDLFMHSVNVAVLSCLTAKHLNIDEKQCQTLALAALCHDIGELKVPKQIRKSPQPLSGSELSFFQSHPKFSVEAVKQAGSFPKEILPIILNHHECLDGSGYPAHSKLVATDVLTQILAVVEQFEHLCHPLPNQKPVTPQEAFAYIYKHADVKYAKFVIEALLKVMGIYPPGSFVQLSNGEYALVQSSNPKDKLRPVVIMLQADANFGDGALLALADGEVKVDKSVKVDQISKNLLKNYQPKEIRFCYFFDPGPTEKGA
ncbi:HD-GYP domain-containing protein [Aliagarivorans marinus]|uniref:HD-GYP domain-containing protein n=1 Tax=Aliagarivorans marinus TaxID=561965 RepID=UPI000A05AA3B|nr:HD-GYP domain-containing protein [Aliagarivorans marinus]